MLRTLVGELLLLTTKLFKETVPLDINAELDVLSKVKVPLPAE
jgi:hypothetical protein